MGEFLRECFLTVNLPVTVMLLTVLGYWLMVIIGVLGLDALDLDLGVDADVDADIDADLDGGGWLGSALEFLYLGDVPVVIVGSFFVVFMWIGTLLSNHYLNEQHSILVMAMWFIPNVILSLLFTRVSMMPFATMFKNYDKNRFHTRKYGWQNRHRQNQRSDVRVWPNRNPTGGSTHGNQRADTTGHAITPG